MFIIKVYCSESQMSFTLASESSRDCRFDRFNLMNFIASQEKHFALDSSSAYMTIMDERGSYFKPGQSEIQSPVTYVIPINSWEIMIPLNEACKKLLKETKTDTPVLPKRANQLLNVDDAAFLASKGNILTLVLSAATPENWNYYGHWKGKRHLFSAAEDIENTLLGKPKK